MLYTIEKSGIDFKVCIVSETYHKISSTDDRLPRKNFVYECIIYLSSFQANLPRSTLSPN